MKKNTPSACLALALLFFLTIFRSFPAQAQFTYGYEFKNNRKRVEIPFEWQCNLIVVPIRINGSDTLNFILDTGVGMNLITDPKVASSLGLKYVKKIDIVGAGEGDALEANVAIGNQIYMSGVRATGQSVVALSEDVLALSDYVGMPIHGVFGYDLFRSFMVEIDFRNRVIVLHHPKYFKADKHKGEKIPVMIEDGKPYVMARVSGANNTTTLIKVLLDTGAGHALSLERVAGSEVSLPDKTLYSQLGRGLSGIIHGQVGRLNTLKIGSYVLPQVITSFPDTNSLSSRILRTTQRQGNIGGEILKRFRLIFNYNEGYVLLKPNKSAFNEPFERDMTGIVLRANGTAFEKYFIERIETNSPAWQAGLQPGDEIIAINERMTVTLKLNDIYKMFQKGDGRLLKLFIKRQGMFLYTEFQLRKMI